MDRIYTNKYIIRGSYTDLLIMKGGVTVGKCVIDTDDIPLVNDKIWYISHNGYVVSTVYNKDSKKNDHYYIHRIIKPTDMIIDHKNRDKLNNRKYNLIECTVLQNNLNRGIQSNNTSGHKGISFDKRRNKWRSRITVGGHDKHLGYFDTIDGAINARSTAELIYHQQKDTFDDISRTHIIAFDFDGTLTMTNTFPDIGEPRPFAKQVVNLLHDIGVTVLIWTCRDADDIHDDITPMIKWLKEHDFRYSGINSVIEHSYFPYEARKIYAHMYVDDRAYGWNESHTVMIDVLDEFMKSVMEIDGEYRRAIINRIYNGEELNIDELKEHIY